MKTLTISAIFAVISIASVLTAAQAPTRFTTPTPNATRTTFQRPSSSAQAMITEARNIQYGDEYGSMHKAMPEQGITKKVLPSQAAGA